MRLALLHDLTAQTAGLEVATGLGGLAVAVVGRARWSPHGWIAPTLLPLLMLVSIAAFLPVSEIAQVGRQLADTIASTRRLHVVHAEPVPITDGPRVPAGAARRLDGALRACALHLSRAGSAPALADVDFEVPAGATVALVGPSGAGKTTIANLLLRFWDPEQGRITLDGVDLRELTLDDLRRRIALVAQDTYLFNDTLRGEYPARPARGRRARRSRRALRPGGAGRVRRRPARRACRPGSANAACSCPAASASASPSRAPS